MQQRRMAIVVGHHVPVAESLAVRLCGRPGRAAANLLLLPEFLKTCIPLPWHGRPTQPLLRSLGDVVSACGLRDSGGRLVSFLAGHLRCRLRSQVGDNVVTIQWLEREDMTERQECLIAQVLQAEVCYIVGRYSGFRSVVADKLEVRDRTGNE